MSNEKGGYVDKWSFFMRHISKIGLPSCGSSVRILFNDQNGQQGTYMTYDKYCKRFQKVMDRLKLKHRPHETRHTFITKAKAYNIDESILKLIVGHSIEDITEKVYTHRTIEQLRNEIEKIAK